MVTLRQRQGKGGAVKAGIKNKNSALATPFKLMLTDNTTLKPYQHWASPSTNAALISVSLSTTTTYQKQALRALRNTYLGMDKTLSFYQLKTACVASERIQSIRRKPYWINTMSVSRMDFDMVYKLFIGKAVTSTSLKRESSILKAAYLGFDALCGDNVKISWMHTRLFFRHAAESTKLITPIAFQIRFC